MGVTVSPDQDVIRPTHSGHTRALLQLEQDEEITAGYLNNLGSNLIWRF